MALQTFNFPSFGNVEPQDLGENLFQSILQGYQMGQLPEQTKRARELENLNLEDKRIKNKYSEESEKAKIALINAKMEHQKRLASEGGFRGLGGRSSNPYYGLPELGKLIMQQHEIESGYVPGSGGRILLNPEQKQELLQRNQLAMQKIGTDSRTRERALFANNLVKTIDSTDVDSLVRYSGPKGAAKLAIEKTKELAGNPSEDYIEYNKALTASKIEAKELRQFLGDSITKTVQESIEFLTNPTSWDKDPKVAKSQVEKAQDTIRKQLETYQNALTGVEPYQKKDNKKGFIKGKIGGLSVVIPIDKKEAFLRDNGVLDE